MFTDCSHGAWDDAAPLAAAAAHPDTSLLVIDVGATAARNFAVDAIELSSERLPAGTPLGITVTTRRSGTDAERAVAVDLVGPDGRPTRRAVKPGSWKGAGGQVAFEIAGLEPGIRQGRVVIDGVDDLEADDAVSFTVDVSGASRVLVAAAPPATRSALFLTQAIAPVALVATRCAVRNGCFTGEVDGSPCFGAAKPAAVTAWLSAGGHRLQAFESTHFYSDSANDLPLLEAVSHPVVVDADARLEALARERGWPRLSWAIAGDAPR